MAKSRSWRRDRGPIKRRGPKTLCPRSQSGRKLKVRFSSSSVRSGQSANDPIADGHDPNWHYWTFGSTIFGSAQRCVGAKKPTSLWLGKEFDLDVKVSSLSHEMMRDTRRYIELSPGPRMTVSCSLSRSSQMKPISPDWTERRAQVPCLVRCSRSRPAGKLVVSNGPSLRYVFTETGAVNLCLSIGWTIMPLRLAAQ